MRKTKAWSYFRLFLAVLWLIIIMFIGNQAQIIAENWIRGLSLNRLNTGLLTLVCAAPMIPVLALSVSFLVISFKHADR